MFDTFMRGDDWSNRLVAGFLAEQQIQFRVEKGDEKLHPHSLIRRCVAHLFCQYFEPAILYQLNTSSKRRRKAGITSASNHGFFLIHAVLRQLGCGKGI